MARLGIRPTISLPTMDDAVAFGFALDHFEDAMQRSLLEVGHVDGNLREMARAEVHAHGLYVTQAAIREADVLADFFGDFDVGSIEVDIVGDEKFARADDSSSGGGMQALVADVRSAIGIFRHFGEQAFKLAFADIFKIGAFGALRGSLVEIDGNFVALPDFAADFFREGHAIFDGDAFDGDEWDYVGCAHARMCA